MLEVARQSINLINWIYISLFTQEINIKYHGQDENTGCESTFHPLVLFTFFSKIADTSDIISLFMTMPLDFDEFVIWYISNVFLEYVVHCPNNPYT